MAVSAPSLEEISHRAQLAAMRSAGRPGYDIEYLTCYTSQLAAYLASAGYDVPARRLREPAAHLRPTRAWVSERSRLHGDGWREALIEPRQAVPPSAYDHRLAAQPRLAKDKPHYRSRQRSQWAHLDDGERALAKVAGYNSISWDLGRDPPGLRLHFGVSDKLRSSSSNAVRTTATAALYQLLRTPPLPPWARRNDSSNEHEGIEIPGCEFNWIFPPASAARIGWTAQAIADKNGLAAWSVPTQMMQQLAKQLEAISKAGTVRPEASQALQELAVELADMQATAAATELYLALGRVSDPAHDLMWTQYCAPGSTVQYAAPKLFNHLGYAAGGTSVPSALLIGALPWSSQGCWYADQTAFGDAVGAVVHYIFKFVNIGLCLALMLVTLVYRGAFNGEYVLIHRTIAAFVLIRLMRTAAFVATTLPIINISCRARFSGITNGGGCGDYLFSGHGSIIVVSMCLFWSQRNDYAPRWPLVFLLPLSMLLVLVLVGYAIERWHYTIDVVLGLFCPAGIWVSLRPIFGPELVWARHGLRKMRFLYLPNRFATEVCGLKSGTIGPLPVWVLVFPIAIAAVLVGAYSKIWAAPISGAKNDATFGLLEGTFFGIVLVCTTCDEEVLEDAASDQRDPPKGLVSKEASNFEERAQSVR